MAGTARRQRANLLTPLQVQKITEPGRHGDGNGLYLEIDKTGAKRWTLRIVRRMANEQGRVVRGTRHDLGLGRASDVSLADARKRSAELRLAALDGADVVTMLRAGRIAASAKPAGDVLRFTAVAEQVHATFKAGWSNGKHAEQWLQTVKLYVDPIIGTMPIAEIEQKHVIRCLTPIWLDKQETARL